jgi:hypothetical protein
MEHSYVQREIGIKRIMFHLGRNASADWFRRTLSSHVVHIELLRRLLINREALGCRLTPYDLQMQYL